MMAIVDVSLDYLRGNVPYRTKKLTRTPKMPFSKMLTQPRMLPKKFVGTTSFKQLKSLGNTHSGSYLDKQMDMVRLDLELVDFHVPLLGNFSQKLFAMLSNCLKPKWVSRVLGLPHKMVSVLTDTVPIVAKSFHFILPPRFFCGAYANLRVVERASYAARSSSYFTLKNSLRRLETRAKARGILCM